MNPSETRNPQVAKVKTIVNQKNLFISGENSFRMSVLKNVRKENLTAKVAVQTVARKTWSFVFAVRRNSRVSFMESGLTGYPMLMALAKTRLFPIQYNADMETSKHTVPNMRR